MMKRILLVILLCFSLSAARAQMVGIKTNALYDVACAPNLALEVGTSSKTSLSVQCTAMWDTWYKGWTKCKWTRVLSVNPEFRYWINGSVYNGFFIGGSAQFLHYSVIWGDDDRYGNGVGLGLTFGYDMYLSRHWAVEFHGGLNALQYWGHHYVVAPETGGMSLGGGIGNPGYKEHGLAILPYQIGVSFVYMIK